MWYGTILSPRNTKLYSVCIVEEHAALNCVDFIDLLDLVELEGRKNIGVDKSIIVIPYFAEFR